jgi:hypothetical protein
VRAQWLPLTVLEFIGPPFNPFRQHVRKCFPVGDRMPQTAAVCSSSRAALGPSKAKCCGITDLPLIRIVLALALALVLVLALASSVSCSWDLVCDDPLQVILVLILVRVRLAVSKYGRTPQPLAPFSHPARTALS